MELTTFLASIWGPVLFAIGLGVFLSRSYYVRVYRDLEKDALAVLVFGMAAMAAGIIHVSMHNVWGSALETLVSILGWGLLIKGTMFVVLPRIADRGGDWVVRSKFIPVAGAVTLIIGGYLSWVAYFA